MFRSSTSVATSRSPRFSWLYWLALCPPSQNLVCTKARSAFSSRDEGPNVVSFQQVLSENDAFDDYYETQYGLLQSRALARRTIDNLGLWSDPIFNQPPRFTIRGLITWPLAVVAGWLEPPEPTQLPDAAETSTESGIIDQFLNATNIEAAGFSRLVDVTFSSRDPILAAKVANTLSDEYIQQSLELRSSTTQEATEFLGEQLAEQREKLEASEQALQSYRERTDSVSLEERQNVVVQRLSDLNAAVTRANTTRIQKETAYRQVSEAQDDPAAIDRVPLIVSNALVQQQKIELGRLEQQRAQLSEKLGPNHPDMVTINLAIQNAEVSMRAEVAQVALAMQSEYEAAVAEEQTLQAALAQQTREAQQLNRAGIEYGVLERDAEADRQMFETLLQRTQETGVAGQLESGNIRVVDYAETPTSPASPDMFRDLLMAILGGFTLAIGLVFAFEHIDDRLKHPDEMKRYLGLPFLGMVPALSVNAGMTLLSGDGVSSVFSESFRSIRTNVLFSSTDDGGRLIVVTSSAPSEGKTVVSTNLSAALAQSGHRVLLIDADMRKPRVHEVFGLESTPGLSNVLVGNVTASEAIRESSTSGLWVLPAGTNPPNPAELLGSKRFRDFAALLLRHFDWVILDTPPVMAVTDASIAANISHGVLFVVGAEMTSRRTAQRAIEQLSHGQARFLGTVLNRVNLQQNPYYYSKYYRSEYGGYYGTPVGAPGELQPSAGRRIAGFADAGGKRASAAPVAAALVTPDIAADTHAPAEAEVARWTSARAARRKTRRSERTTFRSRASREA